MPSNGGNKLAYGPVHCNSNVITAIDIRVGGPDATKSDIIEICCIPLNHSYKVHPEFKLFHTEMRPSWNVDKKFARINQDKLDHLKHGLIDGVDGRSQFENWCNGTLKLKFGKKVLPLVFDWASMKPYMQQWLGSSFEELIDESVRDMLSMLNFLNDRDDRWGRDPIYKHPTFGQLMSGSRVSLIERNSTMSNAKALIDCYEQMLTRNMPG